MGAAYGKVREAKALRSDLVFIVIAEVFFLVLVAAGVGLLVIRRRLRKERERSDRLNQEVTSLRQRLEMTHQHLQAANDQVKALQEAQQQKCDPLLLNYQQRIANLEKFKDLYFELEDRLLVPSAQDGQHLQGEVDSQKQLIAELQTKLSIITKNYGMELDLTEDLRVKIRELEQFTSDLQQGMDDSERQRTLAAAKAEESTRIKERVRELESTERRLQEELIAHTRRIQDLEARQSSKPMFGAVRIKEVEEVNQRLKERENEIRRLRQECETIGIQYEELAAKSLELASGRGDLTAEQKAQLDTLKQSLEENAAALARKQAECEMLENYYLELEQTAQLSEAAERMQQSYAERNSLQEERRNLNDQVESAAEPEAAAEMAKLRDVLADRESSLNDIREQYKEIKEQFIAVAQEENELRENNELLKKECDKLRQELQEIKAAHQDVADEQRELEKLRAEYSKMESRYLALVKKVQ